MISVLVGEEKIEFIVHKDLICERARFFKAALSKDWTEAHKRIIYAPLCRPEHFKIYLEWLYTQTKDLVDLACTAHDPNDIPPSSQQCSSPFLPISSLSRRLQSARAQRSRQKQCQSGRCWGIASLVWLVSKTFAEQKTGSCSYRKHLIVKLHHG